MAVCTSQRTARRARSPVRLRRRAGAVRHVRDALRDSALIFTVSECTKRDILSFYDVPEEKIIVTYQALPHGRQWPGAAFAAAILEQYGLRQGEYLLFVGNIEPKKNVRFLTIGPPMLPVRNKAYTSGLTHSLRGSKVFISKGIGWTHLPVRFNCYPEIAVLELVPETGAGR